MAKRGGGRDPRGEQPRARDADKIDFPFGPYELLRRGLAELGLPAEGLVSPLEKYVRELELFNSVFDLVGAECGTDAGRSDLVVRHILDSLAPWRQIDALARAVAASKDPVGDDTSGVKIADAGSGAGFPGIPLAIAFPKISFTLVERMSKRCAFLENVVAISGLRNVTILNSEVEDAPPDAFDIVAFRAFRPLDEAMTKTLLRMAKRDAGTLAAWKARREKIEIEMSGIAGLVGEWECVPLNVPFLGHEERNLVLISSGKLPCRSS